MTRIYTEVLHVEASVVDGVTAGVITVLSCRKYSRGPLRLLVVRIATLLDTAAAQRCCTSINTYYWVPSAASAIYKRVSNNVELSLGERKPT